MACRTSLEDLLRSPEILMEVMTANCAGARLPIVEHGPQVPETGPKVRIPVHSGVLAPIPDESRDCPGALDQAPGIEPIDVSLLQKMKQLLFSRKGHLSPEAEEWFQRERAPL